jgi:hypothetical protein
VEGGAAASRLSAHARPDATRMKEIARRSAHAGDRFGVVFLYKSKTSDQINPLQRTEEMGLFPIGMARALFKVGDEASVL